MIFDVELTDKVDLIVLSDYYPLFNSSFIKLNNTQQEYNALSYEEQLQSLSEFVEAPLPSPLVQC